MKLFLFEARQAVRVFIEQGCSFFSDPGNLAAITPPWLNIEITSDPPTRMYPGQIVTYRIRPFLGIPTNWVTEITHVDEPVFFVDEQRFRRYRFRHHQHRFREIEGGMECLDAVHYALPPVPLTALMNRAVVHRKLERIFNFKREALEQRFGRLPWNDESEEGVG